MSLKTFLYTDFDSWMYSHNHGHTNDGECLGYGYTKLTSSGQYVDLSSGSPYGTYQYYSSYYLTYLTYYHYYDYNERCYWGIYAPGATKLKFEDRKSCEIKCLPFCRTHVTYSAPTFVIPIEIIFEPTF